MCQGGMFLRLKNYWEYEVLKMKKQAFLRGLLGFPLGIALGYVITIIISLIWANGYYSACVPVLVEQMGSEIAAVILQAVLCGLLGAGFAAASIIWEIENWSIAKQTGIYFLITACLMLPIAYFTNWMEHSFIGFLSYFGIFVGIFVATWVTQYILWKKKIKKLNEKL